jgi:hypothetical protein
MRMNHALSIFIFVFFFSCFFCSRWSCFLCASWESEATLISFSRFSSSFFLLKSSLRFKYSSLSSISSNKLLFRLINDLAPEESISCSKIAVDRSKSLETSCAILLKLQVLPTLKDNLTRVEYLHEDKLNVSRSHTAPE